MQNFTVRQGRPSGVAVQYTTISRLLGVSWPNTVISLNHPVNVNYVAQDTLYEVTTLLSSDSSLSSLHMDICTGPSHLECALALEVLSLQRVQGSSFLRFILTFGVMLSDLYSDVAEEEKNEIIPLTFEIETGEITPEGLAFTGVGALCCEKKVSDLVWQQQIDFEGRRVVVSYNPLPPNLFAQTRGKLQVISAG